MNAWIIQSLLRLRSSYYFIPGIMGVGAVFLAIATTIIDLRFAEEVRGLLGWFFASTVDSARSVLTTIAGSMISVAAVTFSLTMVAVTTAAGQYGPRLIGNFMRDRANQVTLGMFLATFLYCIVVLKSVSEEISIDSANMVGLVPSLSVLVAIILTLISVGVLIFFVHHIPETLNVGNITGDVSKGLIKQIKNGQFPQSNDLETAKCDPDNTPFETDDTQIIQGQKSGYIQAVSLAGLTEWAKDGGYKVRLLKTPGEFVIQGDALAELVQESRSEPDDKDEIAEKLISFIAIGRERTAHQNLLFLADELVEIAARALSPGVNDPFTAINCIHWYSDICQSMMASDRDIDCVLDSEGETRIWAKSVTFDRLCDTLFGQSQQYICEDENTARLMMQTLTHLKDRAKGEDHAVLNTHLSHLRLAIAQSSMGDGQKTRLLDV